MTMFNSKASARIEIEQQLAKATTYTIAHTANDGTFSIIRQGGKTRPVFYHGQLRVGEDRAVQAGTCSCPSYVCFQLICRHLLRVIELVLKRHATLNELMTLSHTRWSRSHLVVLAKLTNAASDHEEVQPAFSNGEPVDWIADSSSSVERYPVQQRKNDLNKLLRSIADHSLRAISARDFRVILNNLREVLLISVLKNNYHFIVD